MTPAREDDVAERVPAPALTDAAARLRARRAALALAVASPPIDVPRRDATPATRHAALVEPDDAVSDAIETTRSNDAVPARDAEVAERDTSPATRKHRADIVTDDDADDPDDDVDAPGRSKVRSRSWAGRGPAGANVTTAPPWLKRKVSDRPGNRVPMWARTNATWLRFGTAAYVWSDRLPPRFAYWPRILQGLAQLGGVLVAAVMAYAWVTNPLLAAWVTSLTAAAVCGAAGWALANSLLLWPHRRRWVNPTAQVLASVLGYLERTPTRRWLRISKDFAQVGGQIEVALPPTMATNGDDDLSREILAKMRDKLCLRDIKATWQTDGHHHTLVVRHRTPTAPVPMWARFSDGAYREVIDGLTDSELAIGLTNGLKPVTFNLDTENPHVLVAVGSGGGKSELLKNFGAQLGNRGADLAVLDAKWDSLGWAYGISDYHREIAEIHCALVALGRECERRNREAGAALELGRPKPNPRRLAVLFDEAPETVAQLRMWWAVERKAITEDMVGAYGDPAWSKSPAVMGLFTALTMGRARNVNVFLVSQVGNANDVGGSAVRSMLGLRVIGRQPRNVWDMIAKEIDHPPVCSRRRGRVYPVMDGQVFETQGGFWTDDEARAYVLAGRPQSRGRVVAQQPLTRANPRDLATGTSVIDVGPRLVSLKQASSDQGAEIVSYTYQTLRKWQAQGGVLPEPAVVAKRRGQPTLYLPDALSAFEAEREAAKL